MKDLQIFDNLLSPFQEDYFSAIIFGKSNMADNQDTQPTVEFTVKYELTAQEGNIIPLSLMHILKSSSKMSQHFDTFSVIPIKVCEKINKQLLDIWFARIWLTLPYETSLEYAKPHTDLNIPHWVVLYYVNDADGDTVFFDNNDQELFRVTPKKGRIVLFNGGIMHSGGIPKKFPRSVINFNIAI